jgi:hypothetical protein
MHQNKTIKTITVLLTIMFHIMLRTKDLLVVFYNKMTRLTTGIIYLAVPLPDNLLPTPVSHYYFLTVFVNARYVDFDGQIARIDGFSW